MRFAAALTAAGLLLITLIAAVVLPPGHETLAQSTTTIQVGDYYFCAPSFENGVCETTVNAGDTVEWQWAGADVHTTTECGGDHDTCADPHLWDSPAQDSGSFSFTFGTTGTYLYRCQVHPVEMRGQVTVLAAAEPSPSPQPSPQASPQASPAAQTPAPIAAGPSAVPSGGGVPPEDGAAWALWLAVAAGAALAAAGLAIGARAFRR